MLEKKIIVTGGTYGIGASIVRALVAANATVALIARSVELGRRQAAELSQQNEGQVRYYRCDVSVRSEVKSAFATAVAEMGGLDALVHVAGVEAGAKAEEESDEQWDRMFAINAKGTFITNQEAFPYLKDRGGRILNFGAGAGITGVPGIAAYSRRRKARWWRGRARWRRPGGSTTSRSTAVAPRCGRPCTTNIGPDSRPMSFATMTPGWRNSFASVASSVIRTGTSPRSSSFCAAMRPAT